MSVLYRIRELLDANNVKYTIIIHSPAFTAQEIASSSFVSGKELAKTVILNVNGDVVMAVIPAHKRLFIPGIKKYFEIDDVSLATESEFSNIFSECKTGAMPPFGNLYDMKTYICKDFEKQRYIVFNAGNHRELIKMKYSSYEKLVMTKVIPLPLESLNYFCPFI